MYKPTWIFFSRHLFYNTTNQIPSQKCFCNSVLNKQSNISQNNLNNSKTGFWVFLIVAEISAREKESI